MQKWKIGKRRAEKDEFQGTKLYLCVSSSSGSSGDLEHVDEQREAAETLFRQMDTALKGIELVAVEHSRRALAESRDLRKTADLFRALAGASFIF